MAHVRQCNSAGIPATVARKGEAKGGTLILKINQLEDGCRVLSQARDLDGNLGWLAAFKGALVPEPEADAYIAQYEYRTVLHGLQRDPDLWVVEIEDRAGWHPFEGKVL